MEKSYYEWVPDTILNEIEFPLTQVYGFLLDKKSHVCLVRDFNESFFTLPGGRIEKKETSHEAMLRECLEEAQFIPPSLTLLGVVKVIIKDSSGRVIRKEQQARYFGIIPSKIKTFVPRLDGFEIEDRIFVPLRELKNYIGWINSSVGKKIIEKVNYEQKKLLFN